MTKKYETEAVMLEMAKKKKKGSTAKCRLKPVAGGTAIEIDGRKYLVGRQEQETGKKKARIAARLWSLNTAGTTKTKFDLDKKRHKWALAAWQAQRKLRLVVDVRNKKNKKNNRITKITLL
jgi:hypothetical protein